MKETKFMEPTAGKTAKIASEIDAIFAKIDRIDERIAASQQRSKIIRAETREILDRLKAR